MEEEEEEPVSLSICVAFKKIPLVCSDLRVVGKHVICDVIFVTVWAQHYWNLVSFCLYLYKTKVVKTSNQFVS